MPSYRRILVAVDLTDTSRTVAERGCAIAALLDSDVQIVHVVEPLPVAASIPPEPLTPDFVDAQEKIIEAAEEKLASLASKLDLPRLQWSVEVGRIKTEIVRVAREHGIDLIVLGNRERHGLAFIFGPTEDAVLHAAPCDVLAVRIQ